MNDNLNARIKERRKRIFTRSIFSDLLLLLPPIFLLIGILFLSVYSFLLSMTVTYFVLPMFYAVERRIFTHISGIGNPKYSYADGYKAFFTARQGGVFGVMTMLGFALIIFFAGYMVLSPVFPYMCNAFPGARNAYDELSNLVSSQNTMLTMSADDLAKVVEDLLPQLTQPLTLFIGAALFVPIFYGIFFSLDSHLQDHYLSSIVLPDIDLNVSASQARAVSRLSYKRYINSERLGYSMKANWPYYLAFALLYGGSLYLFSSLSSENSWLTLLLMIATPATSFLYGLILNYFCLANHYAVLEEVSPLLLERLGAPMKNTIYQTYIDSSYVHGQESAARGCFVPQRSRYEREDFSAQREDIHQEGPKNETQSKTDSESPNESTAPEGGVFDFSDTATHNESEDDDK